MGTMENGAKPSRILNFQAIGRVLARVQDADADLGAGYEAPLTAEPAEWERVRKARADLSRAISWAYTLREAHGDWTSASRARRRYAALGRARRLTRELAALIQDKQLPLAPSIAPWFRVVDEHGFQVADFAQLVGGLERLQEACRWERERLKESGLNENPPAGGDSKSSPTPGTAFIIKLGKAFEEAFGQAPAIKFTAGREPAGPFVQFVEAVTSEMGEPMSPEGIRKAWDRANGRRTKMGKNLKVVP